MSRHRHIDRRDLLGNLVHPASWVLEQEVGNMRFKLLTVLMLSVAVMANMGTAHAASHLPKDILGLWCIWGSPESSGEKSYLRNDASAEKPSTPCLEGGNTEWLVIDANGSYHGAEYKCRALGITVIDHGEVIGGQPGANAVYGVDAQCESKGISWREREKIAVERWGSALSVTRTTRDKQ
jgi:hypothetical protein